MPGSEQQVLRDFNTDSTLTDAERLALISQTLQTLSWKRRILCGSSCAPRWTQTPREETEYFSSVMTAPATIQETAWQVSQIDLGREIFVDGNSHYITSINVSNNSFAVDPAYTGEPGNPVRFLAGSAEDLASLGRYVYQQDS